MNKLVQALQNTTTTDKGALAYSSTGNPLLDLFSLGGSYRTRTDEEIIALVDKAYKSDIFGTIKCLFYLRDARGGQGERRFFRVGFLHLLDTYTENFDSYWQYLLTKIPEYGRWDDLIYMFGKVKVQVVSNYIREILSDRILKDLTAVNVKSHDISLLGKWLPSENTSSKETVQLAKRLRKALGLQSKNYRKILSNLRAYLKIVERDMSSNKWEEVNYSAVPSKAMLKYRKAFDKHDQSRYQEYLRQVQLGEKKINTSTLYPAEIVYQMRVSDDVREYPALQALWDNLPDYINEENKNALVIADTSGSMLGGRSVAPIDVAVSLALYFAQRCNGEFANSYITFSESPQFIEVKKKDLDDNIEIMLKGPWGWNTQINRVFDLILGRAKAHSVPESDMPKILYIISDMQFDGAVKTTNLETWKKLYGEAGYQLPRIVFWNVNASRDIVPSLNEKGITLVSGYSATTFKFAISGGTPEDFMYSVLNSERYSCLGMVPSQG